MTTSIRTLLLVAILLGITGCASSDKLSAPDARAESDPWEPMNRQVDAFNTGLDKITLKPLAKGYRAVTPNFARQGISNFFANLGTPAVALNSFLQGKGSDGFVDVARFLLNSTVGIGGLLDVGTELGLNEHDEDFGQTLAVWGVGDGPYVVLPFLGPNTLRDALAMPIDYLSRPLTYYENSSVRDKLRVLQLIDIRTRLLSAERFLEDSSDPYITLRESYLQNRNYKVYDGDPPLDDDFYDDMLDEDY